MLIRLPTFVCLCPPKKCTNLLFVKRKEKLHYAKALTFHTNFFFVHKRNINIHLLFIYYCHSSKSTGKETCNTHLCALATKQTTVSKAGQLIEKMPVKVV